MILILVIVALNARRLTAWFFLFFSDSLPYVDRMAPNSEEEGPRLTSVKDGVWSSHEDSNSKVSEAGARN
jgi:hypothetical protein